MTGERPGGLFIEVREFVRGEPARGENVSARELRVLPIFGEREVEPRLARRLRGARHGGEERRKVPGRNALGRHDRRFREVGVFRVGEAARRKEGEAGERRPVVGALKRHGGAGLGFELLRQNRGRAAVCERPFRKVTGVGEREIQRVGRRKRRGGGGARRERTCLRHEGRLHFGAALGGGRIH